MRTTICKIAFLCLFLLAMDGVFGDTDVVSVLEGDSVSLDSNFTEVQREEQILWMFGPKETRIAELYKNRTDMFNSNERFGDRLQLDSFTGSLIIRNTRRTDSGLYKLQIRSDRGNSDKTFSVTVYAPLPVPVVTRNSSICSSSSSSVSNCSLLCSVVNVSAVTLSWYKGNSLLSSISVSDLSISLSLPLEVEYQENNSYSCVINNPITNQTTHLDISELCQPFTNQTQHLNVSELCHTCSDQGLPLLYIVLISAAAGSLLIVAAVLWCCFCWKRRKIDQKFTINEIYQTLPKPRP